MFNNLPKDIMQIIFEFCNDKVDNWNKLNQQFLKGGFNRKNLKLKKYLENQSWCAKKYWRASRPDISGSVREWNPVSRTWTVCPFTYFGEWDIIIRRALVTFTRKKWIGNQVIGTQQQHLSSAMEPVSKWLTNIKKFETINPEFAKRTYLPANPHPIKITRNSKFYIDLHEKKEKKNKKEYEKKKANLYMSERNQMKINNCIFKKGMSLSLSFTLPSGNLHFYKGLVSEIYLHQHRDHNGRIIFSQPRGSNRFNALEVDNYIGRVEIKVMFEDGDVSSYTPEALLRRMGTSGLENIYIYDRNDEV